MEETMRWNNRFYVTDVDFKSSSLGCEVRSFAEATCSIPLIQWLLIGSFDVDGLAYGLLIEQAYKSRSSSEDDDTLGLVPRSLCALCTEHARRLRGWRSSREGAEIAIDFGVGAGIILRRGLITMLDTLGIYKIDVSLVEL